ncbi:MAG: hypothetical protein Q9191_001327 [Dirinaria sp. TL-2023a]
MITAYRAVLPGVAVLCSLVAFILALCCLLAGTNPNTLQHMELYTLNTSKIASTLVRDLHLPQADPSFNFSSLVPRDALDSALSSAEGNITHLGSNVASEASNLAKNPTGAINDLKNNITQSITQAKQEVSDAVSKAEDALKNATGEIVSTFINETLQTLHVHDFYIGHLLTYCEGNYTAKGKENVMYCSNGKPNNKYNSTTTGGNGKGNATVATGDENPLAFIETLHLPDPAEYALKALTLLAKIISAFYIVGLILVFFALVAAALTIPAYFAPPTALIGGKSSKNTLLRWATLGLSACAFFTLLLATAMVHFLVKKLCGLFDDHPGAGVAAYPGKTFQGCSWASVILVGIATTVAIVDMALGIAGNRARNKVGGAVGGKWWGRRNREEKEEEEYEL